MKRVLIIAYYWPPAGGGGVQRWLKFTKYLPEFGWEPIVYVPEDADYPDQDPTLANDIPDSLQILKQPIWEPYKLFSKFTGKKKRTQSEGILHKSDKEMSFKEKAAVFVRGNFFIPDARKFWIKPSVRYLSKWLEKNPVDLIVTTGTPHSMHLIGLNLKRKTGIPWVADFRDPWTKIEFYKDLRLTKAADRKHHRLEKEVITSADGIVTVSWSWIKDMKAIGATSTKVVTNGYDNLDFQHISPNLSDKFQISHIGTFLRDRNPTVLWKACQQLAEKYSDFKDNLSIQLIGRTDNSILESIKSHGFEENLTFISYVEHDEAIRRMQSSQILLLLINQVDFNAMGRIAGKVFEYLASNRPILCLGPKEGDSAKIIHETGSGEVAGYEESERVRTIIENWYLEYKKGTLSVNSSDYERFSRKNLTRELATFFSEVLADSAAGKSGQ